MAVDIKPLARASASSARIGDSALAGRLKSALKGSVLFDAFSRGRYSTDASLYQVEPIGVVVPRDDEDVAAAIAIAAEEGIPVLPRGAGSSQCGQTVGTALVIDGSRHLNALLSVDAAERTVVVEPGIVLDDLNQRLKPLGLWFPVDVSTSAQATIGGMAGNNSCGTRSLRYGNMVHNVRAINALLADGTALRLDGSAPTGGRHTELAKRMSALYAREASEIAARFPKVQRRVGGYNLDRLSGAHPDLAALLIGSEGTLAWFQRITLKLSPLPRHKVLGVCHFPTFREAMESAQHIVALKPAAVELVDATMIRLGRDIPLFRATMDRAVRGSPAALLLVEFAGEERDRELANLAKLVALMGDLGLPDAVVEATDPAFQSAIWEVRKAGLNIMMSMKSERKPVSFIEDCAVPLEHLADYTERLTAVFARHGTEGTWYAHASEGCLHVRPVLNLKQDLDVRAMRAIAEEAFAMVRDYKGSHSGEHGDGLVRSEFHETMYGHRLTAAFREVKTTFDPNGLFNPGKIVDPSRMDDRSLFRFRPGYRALPLDTALDWSEWTTGLLGAAEMCNNNGTCRKADAGVMCPSFGATGDEAHVTRGRANVLRLALSGQLGPDAFTSEAMHDAFDLCLSCKGCRRECPTGVDMAKMKVEFLHHYRRRHGLSLHERAVAYLPRYAPWAARLGPLLNLRDRLPGLPALSEWLLGFTRHRPMPAWDPRPLRDAATRTAGSAGEVVLLADCFNRWFEADNARAAMAVLAAGGYTVHLARPANGGRPLCCGRTFLSAGLVEEARTEQRRVLEAAHPFVERGVPVVGLEPSCLLTLRDELRAILPGAAADAVAASALLFEEFLDRERTAGRLALPLKPLTYRRALLHGHCHQKAFATMGAVERVLSMVPELTVSTIAGTCCGMAGAFGYQPEHYAVSMAIAERDVLPAVRAAENDTLVVADGTSCRHQIGHGAGREALHVAAILAQALAPANV